MGLAARRDGNQMDGLEQGVCAAHRAGGCNSVLHLCGAIMSHAAEVPSSSTRGRPRLVAGGAPRTHWCAAVHSPFGAGAACEAEAVRKAWQWSGHPTRVQAGGAGDAGGALHSKVP